MAIKTVLLAVFFTLMYKTGRTISARFNKNGEIRFGNFEKIADGQIFEKNGTLINNLTRNTESECLLECVGQEQCLSINLYFDQPNQFQCELLNWGGTAFHRYLKPRANSYTMQLMTACSPNPCKNGGDCIVDAGGQEYICNCTKTSTGKNCEKAETVKCGFHSCHVNATCTNTIGGFNCSCKQGHLGNGTHCCSVSGWQVIFDFESGKTGWTLTGTAFNNQPTYGDNTALRQHAPSNLEGNWWIGTRENRPNSSYLAGQIQGDSPIGTMTSPPFVIQGFRLRFLIGAGCDVQKERAELLIAGKVVAKKTGRCSETMETRYWDVSGYQGQTARVRLVDNSSVGWGHINFDHLEGHACTYA